MFVLGITSPIELLLLILVGGWLVLRVGPKLVCLLGRGVPLAVLGVAAIIGGVALFAPHAVTFRMDNDAAETAPWRGDGFIVHRDLSSATGGEAHRGWNVQRNVNTGRTPKWLLVSLGTILIISGALLAGRGRTGPAAIKAFTALGIAAILFSVVNFFGSSRDSAAHGERIVNAASSCEAAPCPDDGSDSPLAIRPSQNWKRHTHAKRPAIRPDRPTATDDLVATLTNRAGEIPVELNQPANKTGAQTTVPQPVTPQAEAVAEADQPPTASPEAPQAPTASSDRSDEPAPAAVTPPAQAKTLEAVAPKAPDAAVPKALDAGPAAVAATVPAALPPAEQPKPQPPAAKVGANQPAADQGRPAWVDATAGLVNGVYSMPVASGLFASVPECQHALDVEMKQAADQYIVDLLDDPRAAELVAISLDYLKRHVKKSEYDEIVRSESVGPMHQIHALLQFDDDARADFRHLRHDAVVVDRLWYAGSGAALVLAVLATLYGYLRLDLRSGGTNKARLQLAATLVALIGAAGILLVRWAVPF